jgi:methionyl-tRNA formyltransferase
VLQPLSLRMDSKDPQRAEQAKAAHQRLLATPYDVMVVAAYLILPRSTLDIKPASTSTVRCCRAGAAPRRSAPSRRATRNRHHHHADGRRPGHRPDAADRTRAHRRQDTTGSLHDKLAAGRQDDRRGAAQAAAGQLEAVPQPEEGVNYAAKISKEEAALDFSQSAVESAARSAPSIPSPARMAASTASHQTVGCRGADASKRRPARCCRPMRSMASWSPAARRAAPDPLQKPGGKRLPAAEFIKGFPLEGLSFS